MTDASASTGFDRSRKHPCHAKPYHDDALVDALVEALLDVWAKARACAEALGSGS
jgi:hypothetical protein